MPRRYCTIPSILGLRDWFEARFGGACHMHDRRYGAKERQMQGVADQYYTNKLYADFEFLVNATKARPLYGWAIGLLAQVMFWTWGWVTWYTVSK